MDSLGGHTLAVEGGDNLLDHCAFRPGENEGHEDDRADQHGQEPEGRPPPPLAMLYRVCQIITRETAVGNPRGSQERPFGKMDRRCPVARGGGASGFWGTVTRGGA